MRPPRLIIFAGDWLRSFMTGPNPRRPPKLSSSPSLRPMAGMTLTAVVFELTIPMAASSAMMAEMTSAVVSPGDHYHVEAYGAYRCHGFELLDGERACSCSGYHSVVFADRDECA